MFVFFYMYSEWCKYFDLFIIFEIYMVKNGYHDTTIYFTEKFAVTIL